MKWWCVVVVVVVAPMVVNSDSHMEERRLEMRREVTNLNHVEMSETRDQRHKLEEMSKKRITVEEQKESKVEMKENEKMENRKVMTQQERRKGKMEIKKREIRRPLEVRRLAEMTQKEEMSEVKRHETNQVEMRTQTKVAEEVVEDLPLLRLHPQEASFVSGDSYTFEISLSKNPSQCIDVAFNLSNPLGILLPSQVTVCTQTTPSARPFTTLTASIHGTTTLTATATPDGLVEYPGSGGVFSVVSVMKSESITTVADILGWMYTIAWDISFLPQILHNYRRRSVIGLSFDFLTFNFIGFFSYFLFNMGMLWIPEIQDQYALRNPQSILHVRLNDVIFPLYALLCTIVQIAQCFVYKKEEGQRVSTTCRVLSALLVLAGVIGAILVPLVDSWWWLDELYLLSYVKLAITCIKYVPQLYVNYRSRSTAGWSIYQVILDFTGGSLSLVQMFMLSANYDDWESLLTDPAKLGLGLLSILFNILFFIQHYCLYRGAPDRSQKGKEEPMTVLNTPPARSTPVTAPPTPLQAEMGLADGAVVVNGVEERNEGGERKEERKEDKEEERKEERREEEEERKEERREEEVEERKEERREDMKEERKEEKEEERKKERREQEEERKEEKEERKEDKEERKEEERREEEEERKEEKEEERKEERREQEEERKEEERRKDKEEERREEEERKEEKGEERKEERREEEERKEMKEEKRT